MSFMGSCLFRRWINLSHSTCMYFTIWLRLYLLIALADPLFPFCWSFISPGLRSSASVSSYSWYLF
jgi:hypothetical protein